MAEVFSGIFSVICLSCLCAYACKDTHKNIRNNPYNYVYINDDYFKQEECSICLEKIDNKHKNVKLCCNHIFHEQCILRWFNHLKEKERPVNCALCRRNIGETI